MADGLADFINAKLADAGGQDGGTGDDQESLESPESHDDGDDGDQDQDGSQSLSGDPGDTDGGPDDGSDADEERQVVDSRSRLLRNIDKLERNLTAERAKAKELEQRLRQLEQQSADPEDELEMVRNRIARRMGLDPTDQRVSERMFDLSRDITVAHLGEDVDSDPDLKKRRQELTEERRRRDERIAAEKRIEELERRDRDREAQAQRREAVADVSQMLAATPHPFLSAAVDNPAEAIVDMALQAINEGRVSVRTAEEGARLVQQISANLESFHRKRAERLAALLGDSADNRIGTNVNTTDRDKAAKRTQTGATKRRAPAVGSNGGGGRGRPSPAGDPEMADEGPEDLGSFMNRRKREAESYRRGGR